MSGFLDMCSSQLGDIGEAKNRIELRPERKEGDRPDCSCQRYQTRQVRMGQLDGIRI